MGSGIAIAQNYLDHTEAIDNGYRYLITSFLTVCERSAGEVQSGFGR